MLWQQPSEHNLTQSCALSSPFCEGVAHCNSRIFYNAISHGHVCCRYLKRWMVPSSRHSAMTPLQAPSLSMMRSSAKYSTAANTLALVESYYMQQLKTKTHEAQQQLKR